MKLFLEQCFYEFILLLKCGENIRFLKHYELVETGEADGILLVDNDSAGEDVDTLLLCSRVAFVVLKLTICNRSFFSYKASLFNFYSANTILLIYSHSLPFSEVDEIFSTRYGGVIVTSLNI